LREEKVVEGVQVVRIVEVQSSALNAHSTISTSSTSASPPPHFTTSLFHYKIGIAI